MSGFNIDAAILINYEGRVQNSTGAVNTNARAPSAEPPLPLKVQSITASAPPKTVSLKRACHPRCC